MWCCLNFNRDSATTGDHSGHDQLDDGGDGDPDEPGDRRVVQHRQGSLEVRAPAEAEEEHIADEVGVVLHVAADDLQARVPGHEYLS